MLGVKRDQKGASKGLASLPCILNVEVECTRLLDYLFKSPSQNTPRTMHTEQPSQHILYDVARFPYRVRGSLMSLEIRLD